MKGWQDDKLFLFDTTEDIFCFLVIMLFTIVLETLLYLFCL